MIDKTTLMMPTRRKQDHLPYVSHSGAPDERHFAKPGEPGLVSHPASVGNVAGQTDQTHVKATLGKTPPSKRAFSTSVPIHSGMKTQTRSGGEAFGQDHGSAIDALPGVSVVPGKGTNAAANAHPLVKPPVAKNYGPVDVYPGMRSRVNDSAEGQQADVLRAQGKNNRNTYRDETAELSRRIFEEAVGPTQSGHARARK